MIAATGLDIAWVHPGQMIRDALCFERLECVHSERSMALGSFFEGPNSSNKCGE